MKLLILVLDVNTEPYISIKNDGIKKTWYNHDNENVSIYFYQGGYHENTIIGDVIYSDKPEGFENIGYKTIDAFKHINDLDYDGVFRTNSSSYIDVDKLYDVFCRYYTANMYRGVIGKHNNIEFCSGAGYFLSRNVVDTIIKNENLWDHSLIDDVALGKLLGSLYIEKGVLNRKDYIGVNQVNQNWVDTYHYRCKCPNRRNGGKTDIEIMKKIYEKKWHIKNK